MKTLRWSLVPATVLLAIFPGSSVALADGSQTGFGFNALSVAGFPSGEVFLTGGGAFDPASGSVASAGGFRCTSDVRQGPLTGCLSGEGVRWDTVALLPGTTFKCTGSVNEALKPASTGDKTVVLEADFYRAGDGEDESFTANMIVSALDIAGDVGGVQNVWVQGVGCGSAPVHFSS